MGLKEHLQPLPHPITAADVVRRRRPKPPTTVDCRELTFRQMGALVTAIKAELKRRNPIFVNAYTPILDDAVTALEQIHEGELRNPTCECGPGIKEDA